MKISISGFGEHGKDTLAIMFKTVSTLNYTKSTSAYVKTEMFQYMLGRGATYKDEEECYNDRSNHRELWAEYIDEFNKNDPVALYKRCLAEQDILTGVRRRREFNAVMKLNVIDLAIWVDRPGWHLDDTTQQYHAVDCDITIINDYRPNMLRKVRLLCKALGILTCQNKPHMVNAVDQACIYCGCPKQVLSFKRESYDYE